MFYVWDRLGRFQGALGGDRVCAAKDAIIRAKELGVPAPWAQRAEEFDCMYHGRGHYDQELRFNPVPRAHEEY